MPNKIPSYKLDAATLASSLQLYFIEFQRLRFEDPQNFEIKLKNSVLLFSPGGETPGFAPLIWLLARIRGASWSETNSQKWRLSPEVYCPALTECGLQMFKHNNVGFEDYRQAYFNYCQSFGFEPSLGNGDHQATNREIWVSNSSEGTFSPEEIADNDASDLWEGASVRKVVNSFERNLKARAECIDAHGLHCAACEMSFERQYGEIGRGFIHVHHLIPLSQVDGEYVVDPIKHLIPLCPNCHAMIHKMDDPADIEKFKERMVSSNK